MIAPDRHFIYFADRKNDADEVLKALNYGHLVHDKVEENQKVELEGIVESALKISSLYEELPVPTNDIKDSLKKWEAKNAEFRKSLFTKYIKRDSDKKT